MQATQIMKTISLPGRGGNESTIYVLIVCKGSFHRINILIFNIFFKMLKIINMLKVRKKINLRFIHLNQVKIIRNRPRIAYQTTQNLISFQKNITCYHFQALYIQQIMFTVATLVGTSFFQRCAEVHEYSPFRDCRQRQYYAPNPCQFVYT